MALLIDIEKLNTQERLELANYLWDSIENPKNESAISDWHIEVLEELMKNKTTDTQLAPAKQTATAFIWPMAATKQKLGFASITMYKYELYLAFYFCWFVQARSVN